MDDPEAVKQGHIGFVLAVGGASSVARAMKDSHFGKDYNWNKYNNTFIKSRDGGPGCPEQHVWTSFCAQYPNLGYETLRLVLNYQDNLCEHEVLSELNLLVPKSQKVVADLIVWGVQGS